MKPCQSFRRLAQSLVGGLIAGTPIIAGQLPGPPDVAEFGRQVAIDGDTAVVGAPGEATALGSYVGAAYVYRRSGDSWVQEAKLTSIEPGAYHAFGTSVAIEGNLIAVGVASNPSGSVELFLRIGTTWQLANRLKPDPAPLYFGRLIAMDNGILAVGNSSGNSGSWLSPGRVLLYQVNGGDPTGPQIVEASDGAAGDSFGASLALKGSRLAVGAPYHDTDGKTNAGAAYLFNVGSFTTFQLTKLKASDGKASDLFGSAVAVDEQRVLVGAPNQSRGGMIDGAAYVFSQNPGWSQEAKLIVPSDPVVNTGFGDAVVLGSNHAAVTSATWPAYGGRIQVYERVSRTWLRRLTLGTEGSADTRWAALALEGYDLLAGFPGFYNSGLANESGAAFVYPIPPPAPAQEIEVYTGTDPNLTEAPANVTRQLGEAWLHQQQSWPVTVFNDGATDLLVTAARLLPGGGDGITVDPLRGTFPDRIFPGETAVITVRTNFETPGLKACHLVIASNDSDEADYDLPLAFDPQPLPAPPGFRVRREGTAVVLSYPQQPGYFHYQVQRSLLVDGWMNIGLLQAEFDPQSNGILMVFRDQNPPPGRAFYRLRIE